MPPEPDATSGWLGPEARYVQAVEAAHRGEAAVAVAAFLDAAGAWERAGRFDAALDACMGALHLDPAGHAVHLRMLSIYRARGWHRLADDRAAQLERLLALGG